MSDVIRFKCQKCRGEGWVCENHPDKAWDLECSCGPGIPCECNPCDAENPPRMSPGFREMTCEPAPPKAESSEHGTDAYVDEGPFTMSRYASREDLYQAMHAHIERLTAENERLRAALEKLPDVIENEVVNGAWCEPSSTELIQTALGTKP